MGGLKYLWRMGDGGTVHGVEGRYSYAMEGMYTITLEVTDTDGDTGEWSTRVTVLPAKGTDDPDGPDGPGGIGGASMVVAGGVVALVVVLLLVFLFVVPTVRKARGPDDDQGEEAPSGPEETPDEGPEPEQEPEAVPPPEPEEVLVEEEVEVLRPKDEEADPGELLQRIKDLELEEE